MFLRSLALKVNLVIAFILVIALGTSAYFTKKNLERQAIETAMTKATILTASVMNSIVVEMSGFCQKDVQKIVANVGAVPEIETVRIFDEEGIIMYSAAPDEVGLPVDALDYSVYKSKEKARPFKSEEGEHRAFCMVQPIENALECRRCHGQEKELLGILDVCVSMADTERRIAENSRFLFGSTLTTVGLVVTAISICFWFLVNIPINRLVRTMAKAEYTTKNIGHYGLHFDFYTHFTSPIRRYPDMMVHRLLQKYLDNSRSVNEEKWEDKCRHSSEMEQRAANAERASIKYKQVEFMKDKVGQDFKGTISGVTEWGFYVELDENKCEGMVSIRELEDDFYEFDDENYCIVGRHHRKIYQLGDTVQIQVASANLSAKQLDFVLAKEE